MPDNDEFYFTEAEMTPELAALQHQFILFSLPVAFEQQPVEMIAGSGHLELVANEENPPRAFFRIRGIQQTDQLPYKLTLSKAWITQIQRPEGQPYVTLALPSRADNVCTYCRFLDLDSGQRPPKIEMLPLSPQETIDREIESRQNLRELENLH